jgi:hypothetical protein
MSAKYMFYLDADRRCVRVESRGVWSPVDVQRYSAEFQRQFAVARERFGSVRMLVDARNASSMDPAVGRSLAALGALFDQPGDRFAVVTPTSLRKQQASNQSLPSSGMAFISINAAEIWLFAHG